MTNAVIEALAETGRWRARDITYLGGRWEQLSKQLPQFATEEFRVANDAPHNPYMRAVVRMPRNSAERPIPVGVVSNTYTLAQHSEVAEKCFEGIRNAGIETNDLRCEIGLTELGEWMNLRVYFPEKYDYVPSDGKKLTLRLECFNSVDGSSRLSVFLGWYRFICSNGLVIGETKAELSDIHDKNLNLKKIPEIVHEGLRLAQNDLRRISFWDKTKTNIDRIKTWADKDVSNRWGKKAACRVFHICSFAHDVEIIDPFARGNATDKPVKPVAQVPGARSPASTLYDVSQALSWVSKSRNNPEERVEWQSGIPVLLDALRAIS